MGPHRGFSRVDGDCFIYQILFGWFVGLIGWLLIRYDLSMIQESNGLPPELRPFFWDVEFESLNWESHRQFIIQRILESGDWQAIRRVWAIVGDEALRHFLISRQGRGLSPRQLRYWQAVLDLPANWVDKWIEQIQNGIWERRTSAWTFIAMDYLPS